MRISKLAILAVVAMIMEACSLETTHAVQQYDAPLGSITDEHGCKPSTGHVWSALRGECIRIWEEGIQLNSVSDTAAYAAFLLLSPDSSRIEAFMAGTSGANPILYREGADADSWSSNSKFSGAYKAVRHGDTWTLMQGSTTLYHNALK